MPRRPEHQVRGDRLGEARVWRTFEPAGRTDRPAHTVGLAQLLRVDVRGGLAPGFAEKPRNSTKRDQDEREAGA